MATIKKFADISDTATSHDVNLGKFVLAAVGQYPEGKMNSFRKYSIHSPLSISTTNSNIILMIQIEGKSSILLEKQQIIMERFDLATIPMLTSFVIKPEGCASSTFYCLDWMIYK